MSEILQGTTPSLKIKIALTDFHVEDVSKLELTIWNGVNQYIKGLTDVTVATADNSFTYDFTEAETLALNPNNPLGYQLRFMFSDGSIVGTEKASISVADLQSKEVMSA